MLIKGVPLVDMLGYESKLEEAPSEAKELQSLGSIVPLIGEEFEDVEPLGTRTDSSHSSASSYSNTPLSHDHPLTNVSPTPTPIRASFHHRMARMTLSVIGDELGNEDIEEDESLDADDEGERLNDEDRGLDDEGHGLDDEGCGLEGEGLGLEEEEAAPEGQQQAIPVVDTATSEPLGLGYRADRRRALDSIEEIIPSTYEVGQSSRSMPEQQGENRVFAFRQPTLTTWVDPEDDKVYTDILVDIPMPLHHQLHQGILQDHTQCLDAMPPTLFADIDRDVRELYTRSGVLYGGPMLALEAWAGHVDTWMTDLSRVWYDDHRLINDMLVQQAALEREL
ncbi:hypothetical protein Tco_1036731 [Tanacetum coccineum]